MTPPNPNDRIWTPEEITTESQLEKYSEMVRGNKIYERKKGSKAPHRIMSDYPQYGTSGAGTDLLELKVRQSDGTVADMKAGAYVLRFAVQKFEWGPKDQTGKIPEVPKSEFQMDARLFLEEFQLSKDN